MASGAAAPREAPCWQGRRVGRRRVGRLRSRAWLPVVNRKGVAHRSEHHNLQRHLAISRHLAATSRHLAAISRHLAAPIDGGLVFDDEEPVASWADPQLHPPSQGLGVWVRG